MLLPVVAVEPLEVVVDAEPEPDVVVGVGVAVVVGVGVGVVDVPVCEVEVPDDGCVLDEPPAEVEDELPVVAPAEEPPVEVELGEVVDVEEVVLVEALAEPLVDESVGVGVCGVDVFEPVVECVFEPVVVVGVGVAVGVAVDVEVFQFVLKVVVVFPFVFDPVIEAGGVTVELGDGVGVVLADVLEVLCVLDVPPLTDGSTLIIGWTLIAGAKVIVATLEARIIIARLWWFRPACSRVLAEWWPPL